MHIIQAPLFDFEAFINSKGNDRLAMVLEALDAEKLIAALEREHWTGRKGYAVRGMWSALIAGVLHQCRSLAEVVRLLERDKDARTACGFGQDNIPSGDALGRFLQKLVSHEVLLEGCFSGLARQLRELLPGFGSKLAVDSTDIQAYSNGHRKRPSDPDARWGAKGAGHRGGPKADSGAVSKGGAKKGKEGDLYWWFGYKLHLVVDAIYELPVSFVVTAANEADTAQVKGLLQKAVPGETKPEAIIMDKGYDSQDNYRLVYKEYKAAPIIPIREREGAQLPDICNAKGTPLCSCGLAMVFWGRDGNYLKYRCPEATGKAKCQSRFGCTASAYGYVLKLSIVENPRRHPPVPRESKKWSRLYRLRTSVERVNSRVKGLLGLGRITVRGLAKVTVRSLLSLLVMLAAAVGMARRNRLKELRVLVT